MNKRVGELLLISNKQLNHDNYLLEFYSTDVLEGVVPGQFVNVMVEESPETYLRRPFSIHTVDYLKNSLSLLIKVVGRGTNKIVQAEIGKKVNMIFPLGRGFSVPGKDEKVLLIGGGVGIAPMLFLAKEASVAGAEVNILLGARTESDHVLISEFEQFGKVFLTTNDGSLGTKGFVTDHSVLSVNQQFKRIYCCGPDAMMHAVAKKAKELNVECEVSLENSMACGFGVCLCCVTKTNEGNKCVCTDGPVFNTKELQWQI